MSEELKPCPFCGCHAMTDFELEAGSLEKRTWTVFCVDCLAVAGFEDTKEEAVARWDNRPALTAALARAEALTVERAEAMQLAGEWKQRAEAAERERDEAREAAQVYAGAHAEAEGRCIAALSRQRRVAGELLDMAACAQGVAEMAAAGDTAPGDAVAEWAEDKATALAAELSEGGE